MNKPSKALLVQLSSRKRQISKPNPCMINASISYHFLSLFNPASAAYLTLYQRNYQTFNTTGPIKSTFRSYKVLVKQSYLMAAWFSYYSRYVDGKSKLKPRGFAKLPKMQTKHTAIKAPMAHKTFSQEQFIIRYYRLVIVSGFLTADKDLACLGTHLVVSNIFRHLPMWSGTNMLILNKVILRLPVSDNKYFSYYSWLTN